MNKPTNPSTVAPPIGAYTHSIEVPPHSRILYISGQVGLAPDGQLAEGVEAQTEQTCRNIIAILEASGMGVEDLVKLNSYLVDPNDVGAFRVARVRVLGDAKPASTLAVIQALAAPQYLVEIEAIAAKSVAVADIVPAAPARRAARKAPARKAPARKAPARKAPARKAKPAAKRPVAKKAAPARKPAARKAAKKKPTRRR